MSLSRRLSGAVQRITGVEEPTRYDAFISYSRKDIVFARALESALEDYRPPKGLEVPERYLTIFRDEGDLTGAEYYQSIDGTLRESGKLIVICSPAARASEYVNDEIRRFVAARGTEHVIPILLAGRPNNATRPGQEAEMAFPEALCEAMEMPLATSYVGFRKRSKVNKGEFAPAWYTVLANLLDRSRSEVEQRDVKREYRKRRIRGSLAAAVIGLLTFAAIFSNIQRNTAVRERRVALVRGIEAQSLLSSRTPSKANGGFDRGLLLAVQAARWAGDSTGALNNLLRNLLANPQVVTFLRGHDHPVTSVAMSPDGRTLAGASGAAVLWDLERKEMLTSLGTVPRYGYLVDFSPDGRQLAFWNGDGVAELWDVGRGTRLRELPAPTPHARSLAFSPRGDALAVGGYGHVALWDLAQPTPVMSPLPCDCASVQALAFSPDGNALAQASDDFTVQLWDLSRGMGSKRLLYRHRSWATSVAFSPAGDLIASGGGGEDNTVTLWHAATETMLGDLVGDDSPVTSLAFNAGGTVLASGKISGAVELWDPRRRSAGGEPLRGHGDEVLQLTFSPHDPDRLVSTAKDTTVILWDLGRRNRLATTLRPGAGQINGGVDFSADGSLLAMGGRALVLLQLQDGSSQRIELDRTDAVMGLAFNPADATILATGHYDGRVRLWDVTTRQPRHDFEPLGAYVTGVAFNASGRLLAATAGDSTLRIWRVEDRSLVSRVPMPGGVNAATFHPVDDDLLVTGGLDGSIVFWDLGDSSGSGAILDSLRHGYSSVSHLAFSDDGTQLASASFDNTITLWRMDTRTAVDTLEAHSQPVAQLAFHPNGEWLVSGGWDRRIIIWDLATGQPVGEPLLGHRGDVSTVAFSPDGKRLASGGKDSTVVLWDLDPASWIDTACRIANRNLTPVEWDQYMLGEPYEKTCPRVAEARPGTS